MESGRFFPDAIFAFRSLFQFSANFVVGGIFIVSGISDLVSRADTPMGGSRASFLLLRGPPRACRRGDAGAFFSKDSIFFLFWLEEAPTVGHDQDHSSASSAGTPSLLQVCVNEKGAVRHSTWEELLGFFFP